MKRNTGSIPAEARGKRVRGVLANGQTFGGANGWAADGTHGCRWSLTGHPFDIAEWELAA